MLTLISSLTTGHSTLKLRPVSCVYNMHCVKSVLIRSYSVRMRENVDQNNSEYRHFLRSDSIMQLHIAIEKSCLEIACSQKQKNLTCGKRYNVLLIHSAFQIIYKI